MTDSERPADYPVEWEADVVLRDGAVAHVRPMLPDDAEGVQRFHSLQSEESIYLRYFAPIKRLSERDVYRFTHVDYDERVALVATVRGEIIGIARFDRFPDRTVAEVAFNIADNFHGKGVGSVLLEHLAAIGREGGISRFVADVLPQNHKMMKVFADVGYEIKHHFDDGVISVSFQIEPTMRSRAVQQAREHRAEERSMNGVLTPASVAVVGVSRRPEAIGSMVLDNIIDGRYSGTVYVVNSEVDHVRGLKTHPRVSDIGAPVDMAVIAVPAAVVLDVVVDCANAGVKTLLVLSAGFAEAGPAGEFRQAELLRIARDSGMRVVGPNSLGLINNHPDVRLNATIANQSYTTGRVALFSQSGGLGIALLAAAAQRMLGLSVFVSAGNRVDVSGNDLMQYLIEHDHSQVVGLYLESLGNPRKFSRIARQVSLRKPVIAVKAHTSGQVPPGHRASRTRVPREAFGAILKQAGVIEAQNVHELMDVIELVSNQPLPRGSAVAVVGNSDGVNAIIVEALLRGGLTAPYPPFRVPNEETSTRVAEVMEQALDDEAVNSVVACFTPPMASSDEAIARAIAHSCARHDKTCVATFLGMRNVREVLRVAGAHAGPDGTPMVVPAYVTPLDGVTALAAVTQYAAWRDTERGDRVHPEGVDRIAAEAFVDRVLEDCLEGRALTAAESSDLLATHGIRLWPGIPVAGPQAAVDAAEELGYPVVIKSMSQIARNIPVASVRTDLHTPAGVREAYDSLVERLGGAAEAGLVVQKMATIGIATMIQSNEDPLFGPVVCFGLAGPSSELLGDLSYGIPPLSDDEVTAMITSLRAAPMLEGYRGAPPVDRAALCDLIARVSLLAEELPEIDSLVLNPVSVHASGVDVLGGAIHLAPASVRKDSGRRALT
ncbi:MAG TPA: GNAT family N-acetyltransferase [Dermatophilaceae bacterium]|nr:GNAT family N-acetyltransferase [Dermatophilaceae bacterium]